MGTEMRMPDGSVRNVDNDGIAATAAQGGVPLDPNATVRVQVRNPTGTTTESEVPYETYLRTAARDPSVSLTPEDTVRSERRLAELEGQTSALGAGLRGFGEELSFGLYSPDDEQRQADEYYHGTAHGIGSVGGAVVPLAIPGLGEAGLARDVAEVGRTAELAARGVEAGRGFRSLSTAGKAAELIPGRALAQVGAGVSERLGGGLLGHVAGGAVEESGRAILRAALDRNVDLSGEAVLDSALLGMAGGGVGYGIAKAARKAGEALEDLKSRVSRVSKTDDEALVRRLDSNRDPTPAQLGRTDAEHANAVRANLSADLPLAGANQAVVRDVSSLERQVGAFRASPFAPALSKEATEAIDRGLESAKLLRTYARQAPDVQARVMASYGNHLQDVDAMADAARRAGMDASSLPSRFMPGNMAARQAALDAIPAGANAAEDVAKRLAVRLTAGTEREAVANGIADALLSRVPVLGKALSRASESPLGSLALLEGIMHGGLGGVATGAIALKAAAKLVEKAYEVPGRGLALSAQAADALGKLGMSDRDRDPEAAAHAIRSYSPQQASQDAVRGATPLGDVHTGVVLAAGQAAMRRQAALQQRVDEIMPQPSGAMPLRQPKASRNQVRALERALRIAGDPAEFARLWAAGRLSAEDLAFAQRVWPAHVAHAKSMAIDWLSGQDPRTVSRSTARRLETLLGSGATGVRSVDSALAAQGSIAAANSRMMRAHSGGGPPGVTPGRAPSRGLMSPALAASTRPSD